MISKIKYWIPAILFMATIFLLSSRPAPEELKHFPIIAKLKLVHIIEYGILYLLVRYAIKRTTSYNKLEMFYLALMITILYGLTDEFHQIYVVSRTAKLEDAIANGVGGLLAQAGIGLSGKFRR